MLAVAAPLRRWSLFVQNRLFSARQRRSFTGYTLILAAVTLACNRLDTTPPAEFAEGISYTNYRSKTPWSVHVVRVNRANHNLDLYATHARMGALGLSTLSDQVKEISPEAGTPLAAINGDYYQREREYAGDPRGLQIVKGEMISGPRGGVSFWIAPDGQPWATNVVPHFTVTWPRGRVTPFGLNEDRRSNHWAVLYTPSVGYSTKTRRGRDLVLEREGNSPWLPLQAGLLYTARVREIRDDGDACISPDVMVLSIKPTVTNRVPWVDVGDVLVLSTETEPNLRDAKTAISGGPMLVINRKRQKWTKPDLGGPLPYGLRSMWERHPRSAIGWNNRNFFLVEVDGRQKGLSDGMTLDELANYMIKLGCQQAMNLDGGGSSMFWCNGKIVNSPCDKKEREIANALVVVTKEKRTTSEPTDSLLPVAAKRNEASVHAPATLALPQ